MRQGVQLRCRGCIAHTGTKANDFLKSVMKKGVGRSVCGQVAQRRKRNPCCLSKATEDAGKTAGRDTNDGEGVEVYGNGAADDAAVRLKAVAPKRVREYGFIVRAIGTIVGIGLKELAYLGLYTKQVKVVRGDYSSVNRLRLNAGTIEIQRSEGEHGRVAERMRCTTNEQVLIVVDRIAVTAEHCRGDETKVTRRVDLGPWIE